MHEEVELGIETTIFDKDIVQMLAILEQTSLPTKFGHDIFEGHASALREGAHYKLVNALNGRWLGLQGDDATKSKLWYYGYFRIDASMACIELMLNNCFDEG